MRRAWGENIKLFEMQTKVGRELMRKDERGNAPRAC